MYRPIHRVGAIVLKTGMLASLVGLVLCLLGWGWTVLAIGAGASAVGLGAGLIPHGRLANKLKAIDESLTPKEASDIAFRHLRARGPDAEDTFVFLGRFGEELDCARSHRSAAERDNPESQYLLAMCFRDGSGVRQDLAQAKRWHDAAVRQGYLPKWTVALKEASEQAGEPNTNLAELEEKQFWGLGRTVE